MTENVQNHHLFSHWQEDFYQKAALLLMVKPHLAFIS